MKSEYIPRGHVIADLSFTRYDYPTRYLNTHDLAKVVVADWTKESDGSPESLLLAIEAAFNGILRALCDA